MTRSNISRSSSTQSKELVSWPLNDEDKAVSRDSARDRSVVARSNWSKFLAGTPLAVPAQFKRR